MPVHVDLTLLYSSLATILDYCVWSGLGCACDASASHIAAEVSKKQILLQSPYVLLFRAILCSVLAHA